MKSNIALAVAVGVLDVAFFSTAGSDLAQVKPGDLAPLLLLGIGLVGNAALIWRRRKPGLVFGVLCLFSLTGTLFINGYQPVLGLFVSVYSVGAHAKQSWAWVIAPATASFAVVAANEAWIRRNETNPVTTFTGLTVFYGLVTAGIWGLGYLASRSRRKLAESARAVAQERQRLSRELHDIVAHTVTVIVLQAAGAQKILHTDPRRASAALGQISELGQQAIAELRRMLAVQGVSTSGQDRFPGAGDIGELIERMRNAGLHVEMDERGEPKALDPSVGLAVYRTVQEALTNAAKHGGTTARVCLDWTDGVVVQVENPKALSTGHGLLGLKERLAIAGGQLDAGPTDGGGFLLTAKIPAGG